MWRGGTGPDLDGIKRTADGIALDPTIELTTLLDLLVATGVSFEIDRQSVARTGVTFTPALTPALAALVEPWASWFPFIAVGRYTGHAPAVCDICGAITMLSIVNSTGTKRGQRSTPWPRCVTTPRCVGHRIIRGADIDGVERVRHRPAPRQPAAADTRVRLPWPDVDDLTGRRRRATSLARELRRIKENKARTNKARATKPRDE